MTDDTVKAPTPAQLKALADDLGFGMSEADLATFGELMRPSVDEGVRFYTKQKAVTSRWPTGVRAGAEFKMPTMG